MRQVTMLKAALVGGSFCAALCAMPGMAQAQVSSINSANLDTRAFNDVPGATGVYTNLYPTSITFSESNVSQANGFADRDIWYFSNNGGTSPYEFSAGDYFHMSFTVNLTGDDPAKDLEAGILFSNPSGSFGGDCQVAVLPTSSPTPGDVVQFGGPSYYDFRANGTPSYVEGTPITMGLNYVIDPLTGNPSFQYSINGTYALSGPGDPYFDFSGGGHLDGASPLGGYFQIGNDPSDPTQSGQAVFSNITITPVPEPASLGLLGLGGLAMLRRRSR